MQSNRCSACLVLALSVVIISALGCAGVETVKVLEDFESDDPASPWTRIHDAPVGRAAGATGDPSGSWSGLALSVDCIPPAADAISFWVRTDDGKTASIEFQLQQVDDNGKTDYWGRQFWATPTWRPCLIQRGGFDGDGRSSRKP